MCRSKTIREMYNLHVLWRYRNQTFRVCTEMSNKFGPELLLYSRLKREVSRSVDLSKRKYGGKLGVRTDFLATVLWITG